MGQSSCGDPGEDTCEELAAQDGDGEIPRIQIRDSWAGVPHDDFELVNWEHDCDYLYLEVAYSGGCERHTFDLYSFDTFQESSPAQMDIWLSHANFNDACEAYVTEYQVYDLTALRDLYLAYYGSEDKVVVHFQGPDNRTLFTFEYDLSEN